MLFSGQVGPGQYGDGVVQPARLGKSGEVIQQHLHGRYYENAYRGNIYGFGLANTVLATTNAVATGLTATAKPVIGVWNPMNSGKNLVILKTTVIHTLLAASAVNTGGFTYCVSTGNGGISTGSVPWNRSSLAQVGSVAKAFAISTALTGLTNNLVDTGMPVNVANFTAVGNTTAVEGWSGQNEDNIEGSFIVPPGGVLAVMNLLSTITVNVTAGMVWEEVPL